MNSCTNDVGDLVQRPWRMCGFLYFNIPIACGIMLAKPTIFNTIFFQFINQSYNAGLNFGNKNSTCEYSNMDLMKGYGAAVSSSIFIATLLRKITAGATKSARGSKLVLLNFLVGASASAAANFCNTFCMRYTEIDKGILVFQDEKLEKTIGVSKKCAESAVY